MNMAKAFFACVLGAVMLIAFPAAAQTSGTWTVTGSMSAARYASSAILLKSGKVLVAGGTDSTTALASAELYDPATGTWSPTGNMKMARAYAGIALLPNGRVLMAGGCTNANCSAATSTAEMYDPTLGVWRSAGRMSTIRYFFGTTLLKTGNVLVEGGCSNGNCLTVTTTAEIFNPRNNQWTLTGSMSVGRDYHTATLLASGKVLITGGYTVTGASNSVELYDAAAGTWTTMAGMITGRALHSATALPDGRVIIAGGSVGNLPSAASEIYDPVANSWSLTGNLNTKRTGQAAVLLTTGKAMVAGGYSYTRPSYFDLASCELLDATTSTWTFTGDMSVPRYLQNLVRLSNGQVLAVGGMSTSSAILSSAELYTP